MKLANLLNDLITAANELSRLNSLPNTADRHGPSQYTLEVARVDVELAETALKEAICSIVANKLND